MRDANVADIDVVLMIDGVSYLLEHVQGTDFADGLTAEVQSDPRNRSGDEGIVNKTGITSDIKIQYTVR